ncbi:phage tail length tape measure family protein [Janthinobacterium fluminis]|uniref:Phage tail length tape measure family protein n=1 Tax=Janthinobacterium fluminis TaxID=2987524 RepID=A0ABT5JU65_9BURK|nr:phage tail length tape measure family protein [Janthinobacterium fluminis]MDC8756264.1 phage tail length tape measure family protein [Janthinobacterium fluminis]
MTSNVGSATIELAVDSAGVESGLQRVDRAVVRTGRTLENLGGKGAAALDGMGNSGGGAAKKVERSTASLISSIQRTTAVMEAGSRTSAQYFEALASQRGVSVDALRPYLDQLDAVASKQKTAENAMRSADPAMKSVGVSAAQTSAALRQMPAQLTDIFTSLAGGQNPLLVLIQQGGQIKDSFGGIANTFSVLGGEVKSFFSSVAGAGAEVGGLADLGGALADVAKKQTAVAEGAEQAGENLGDLAGDANTAADAATNARTALAGVGSVSMATVASVVAVALAAAAAAVAYYQASKEAAAYTRTLTMTGNVAGVTADQLSDMARAIGKSAGTQGAAAEALVALVSTGKVGAENFQRFATVAVKAQKVLGIGVADMVKDFADLGKTPLQASKALNEQYHHLTFAVHSQISALQNQGKMEEAAAVAQNAYADALASREKRVAESLGRMSRAWAAVGGAAKRAGDAFLDVWRDDTFEQKLVKANDALEKAQRNRFNFAGGGSDGAAALATAEKKVALLKEERDASEWNARAKAESAKLDEDGIAWAEEGEKFLARKDSLLRAIKVSRDRGLAAGVADEEIAKRELAIRREYSDIFNAGIDSQIEALKRRAAVEDVVSARSMAMLVANRDAGLASSLQAQNDFASAVAARDIADFSRRKRELEEELALTKGKADSEKEQAALRGQALVIDAQIDSRKRALASELFVLDVKATRAAASAYADVVEKREADVEALKKQIQAQLDANSLIGKSGKEIENFNAAQVEEVAIRREVEAAILDTIPFREKEAAALRDSAAKMRDLSAAQREGAKKSTAFDEQKKIWESIDRTAHDTFVSIFDSGKNTFDRLRDTLKNGLLDMLYQMTIKKWIFQIGASVTGFSGLAQAAGMDAGGAADGAAGGGMSGVIGMAQMASGVYKVISGGLTAAITSMGAGIASVGGMLGSSSISAFGAGMGLTGAQASAAAGAYTAAGMGGTGTAITGGAYAGAAVTAAAGIAAGVLGGSLISGQFGSRSTVNAGTGVGAIAGAFLGGPVGAAIGGALGGIIGGIGNRLFGMGEKKVTARGMRGNLSDAGAAGESYYTWKQKGGLFRSDKGDTERSALGTDAINSLTSGFAKLKVLSVDFAKNLDVSGSALDGFSKKFDIALTGDNTKDAEAITKFFSTLGDELATKLVPTISSLTRTGETASVTLQRLSDEFQVTNVLAGLLGKTVEQAFGSLGLSSVIARERLIDLSGGVAAFGSQTAFFAQNYLSEAERLAPVSKALDAAMASLGLSGIKTRDQFKQTILGLDLTTDAGAKQYAAMMKLQEAFAQVHPEQLQQTIDQARGALQSAAKAQADALKATAERMRTFATSVLEARDAMLLGSLSTLTPAQRQAEAQRQYELTLAQAKAGDAGAQSRIREAANAYLSADQAIKASSDSYAADAAKVQADLAELAKIALGQATEADKQLAALEKQVGGLVTINESVLSTRDAIIALGVALRAAGQVDVTVGRVNGSHAGGLSRVPFDGYVAELHEGERVLTAFEARNYSAQSNVGSGALVAEIRGLREDNRRLHEEVKGLRADKAQQTGDTIASIEGAAERNAEMVSCGAKEAAKVSIYAQQMKAELI